MLDRNTSKSGLAGAAPKSMSLMQEQASAICQFQDTFISPSLITLTTSIYLAWAAGLSLNTAQYGPPRHPLPLSEHVADPALHLQRNWP